LYDGIRVDTRGIERIRSVVAEAKVPVVLVPTHRSYVDFLVISFIFFAYNLPVPFIAADEGFANMTGVSGLLRNSGAFFLKRDGSFQSDELYQVVLTEYVQRLLEDKQTVELFVEGTRSRTGEF
jgi:glycerol-3-phosphate O-acyltransferase